MIITNMCVCVVVHVVAMCALCIHVAIHTFSVGDNHLHGGHLAAFLNRFEETFASPKK